MKIRSEVVPIHHLKGKGSVCPVLATVVTHWVTLATTVTFLAGVNIFFSFGVNIF